MWLEEVDVVVALVVVTVVVALVVVALVAVALGVVALVVLAVVVVVLVEVALGVVMGLSALLVAYKKSLSTRAFFSPSMWRLTLRSKK